MAFLREPESKHEPLFRAPLVVIGLIVVIVAAHLVRVFSPPTFSDAMLTRLAFLPVRYLAPPSDIKDFADDAIPFAGYLFLHANATHLIVNCLWLLAFGAPVARRFHALPFLGLFLLSGIGAALAHLAANWGSQDAAIGASGAIAGIMGAGIRAVWLSDPLGRREGWPLLPLKSRQVLTFSIFWVAVNVLTGLTGLGALPGLELVAWQAHIGGYFAGLLLSGPLDGWIARHASDTGIAAA
jgi:membrane associated rhomboid family serine protease